MTELVIDNQTEYQVIKAEISSDRTETVIDIQNLITDITIYEHIEKPYLTAKIVFIDQHNIIQDLDFQGGEKISLSLSHGEERISGFEISKEFLVDNIENIIKADERSESIIPSFLLFCSNIRCLPNYPYIFHLTFIKVNLYPSFS